ncbi:hypothetical protein [Mangrovimonas sp. DI 80]|uniref:hypothetical protein n=1 Tax=Mangrovimonas sp. DI 80 TaxID=1779330 RepID=UPI0009781396|nr:hypothetical protein [Mangrovimonas sp. DI 80]OMP31195.1 hypothetical protein BKM32_09045 [Mangrovimonas sp. DI 80]
MNRLITLLCFIALFHACHTPKYISYGDIHGTLNFENGKWLLNKIKAPSSLVSSLTDITVNEFSSLLGNRFSTVYETKQLMLPKELPETLSKSTLLDIKNGTGFDFFITVRAKRLSNDMGSLQIGKNYSEKLNSGLVTLEIYDLNLQQKIYSKTVQGNLTVEENDNSLVFGKSSNGLMISSLKKILRKLG